MSSKDKKSIYVVVGIILLLAGCLGAAYILGLFPSAHQPENPSVPAEHANGDGNTNLELVSNPIDFSVEADNYPDIYAWIRIPGTDIDFPVVQHPTDDFYYLDHNASGESDNSGAIYTQLCNDKNFQDPVTVLYGHDMNLSGKMFNQLHLFEDEDFFDSHEYFEIYLPGRIMRYRIISAYASDDRHIMNSFDFDNKTTLKEYYDSVCHPTSLISNARTDAQLDIDDKIVQLSTCMSSALMPDSRYIVTGELIETELTR